jgi:hypothetical protein
MLNDIWFWAFIAACGVLSFTLAHNITTGIALRNKLGSEWKAIVAKWRAGNIS